MRFSGFLKKTGALFVCLICMLTAGCLINTHDSNNNVQDASIPVVSEKLLIAGGHSVGVKMDVKGVLVVGLEDIISVDDESVNPGLDAGLEIGDTIIEIEGEKVYKATEVQRIVNEIKGDISLKIQRKDRLINIELVPVQAKDDGLYKLGVWIKDKTAGIGTLTFYDPETNMFGALGHGITDAETGVVLAVNEGELLDSKVKSVKEGKSGKPGEIHGIFYESEAPLGSLSVNSRCGIFGTTYGEISNSMYPEQIAIAAHEQIEEGPAYILTTISGDKIEQFEIEIERIVAQTRQDTKNMVIRVTDEELLERTGGIVQGMSGSPIIQNGRIVGAVTHVFVNDPTRGYGIFIENMLEEAEKIR